MVRLQKEAPAAEEAHKKTQTDLESATQSVETGGAPITSVAVAADGQTLAFADEKGTTYVWRLSNPSAAINEFTGASPAAALAFLPTPGRLASEGTVEGNSPSLARRAGVLASFAADGNVALRSIWPQWKFARTLGAVDDPKMFAERVMALDFSPDGRTLVTASGVPTRNGDLKFFSVPDGKLVRTIAAAHPDMIFTVKHSHDGRLIASGGGDNYVRIFEAATGKPVTRFETASHRLCVDWRGDDAFVYSSGIGRQIQYHRIAAGTDADRNYPRSDGLQVEEFGAFAFVGHRRALASVPVAGLSTSPAIWPMTPGNSQRFIYQPPGQPKDHPFQPFYGLAVTPDGRLAAGGLEGVLYVWTGNLSQPKLFTLPTRYAADTSMTEQ